MKSTNQITMNHKYAPLAAICLSVVALCGSAQAAIIVNAHTHWSGNGGGLPPVPGIYDHNAPTAMGRQVTALSQTIPPLQAGSGPNSASAQLMARADSNGVHARLQTNANSTGNTAVISRAGDTMATTASLFNHAAGEGGAGAAARLVGVGCVIGNTNVASFLTAMNFKLNGPVVGYEAGVSDTSRITIAVGVLVEQSFDNGLTFTSLVNQTGTSTANFATVGPPTYTSTGLLTGYTGQAGFAIKSQAFNLSTNMAHLMRITLNLALAGVSDPGLTGSASNLVDFSNTFGFDPDTGVLDDLPNDLGGATFEAPDMNVFNNSFVAIPEPTGLALLALSGVVLLRRRSRS